MNENTSTIALNDQLVNCAWKPVLHRRMLRQWFSFIWTQDELPNKHSCVRWPWMWIFLSLILSVRWLWQMPNVSSEAKSDDKQSIETQSVARCWLKSVSAGCRHNLEIYGYHKRCLNTSTDTCRSSTAMLPLKVLFVVFLWEERTPVHLVWHMGCTSQGSTFVLSRLPIIPSPWTQLLTHIHTQWLSCQMVEARWRGLLNSWQHWGTISYNMAHKHTDAERTHTWWAFSQN